MGGVEDRRRRQREQYRRRRDRETEEQRQVRLERRREALSFAGLQRRNLANYYAMHCNGRGRRTRP